MQKTKDISEAIASTLRSYGHVVAADIVIQLEQQRAELLEALKQAIAWMDDDRTPINALANARSIITKAEAAE